MPEGPSWRRMDITGFFHYGRSVKTELQTTHFSKKQCGFFRRLFIFFIKMSVDYCITLINYLPVWQYSTVNNKQYSKQFGSSAENIVNI